MAKYLPKNTSALTNKLGGIVPSSWRGVNTLRAFGSTAPTVIQPANAQQLLTAAAKTAWDKLSDSSRGLWLAIQAIGTVLVTAAGSGYTSPPAAVFNFTTYNSLLLSSGSGYPDTPVGIISGAGVFPTFVPLVVVNGAVELALDQDYITTGTGTPIVTISGGSGSGASAHAENFTAQVWRVVIDSGGSGYGDVKITWDTDPTVTDWGIVSAGRLTGAARRGSSSFSGSTPPNATISGTTGSGAALRAYFMLPESVLPSLTVNVSGGSISSVDIDDPGLAIFGLPSPTLVGGGGTGGAIDPAIIWFANQTFDALGINIALNGFAAWINVYCLLTPIGLPMPPTPAPYENAAPGVGGVGGSIADSGAFINLTNGGSGYSASFPVNISSATGKGYAGTANVSGGTVVSVSTTQTGFHYQDTDVIDWSAGSGSGAAGTITILIGPQPFWIGATTDGSVESVTLSSGGSGYTSPPAVSIQTNTGSGFQGAAIVSGGEVTGVTITNPGHDYRDEDIVIFTGGGGFEASGSPVTDGWKWWYLVYAQRPPHAAGYKQTPAGWVLIGYATAAFKIGNWGETWLNLFGQLPPGGAHIPVKVVQVDNRYGLLGQPSSADLYYAYGVRLCLINPSSAGSGYSGDFIIDLNATFGTSEGSDGRVQVYVVDGVPTGTAVISTGKNYLFTPDQEYPVVGGDGSGCMAAFYYDPNG